MASIAIIAPTSAGNAVGRALALSDLAAASNTVRVFGPADGPVWAGAAQHRSDVTQVGAPDVAVETILEDTDPSIVWMVKPLRPAWRIASQLVERSGARLVIDFDDHDEALSLEFRRASPWNTARIHRLRALHPAAIRSVRAEAGEMAAGITFATHALRRALGLPEHLPAMRIPHPRPQAEAPPAVARRIRGDSPPSPIQVGCLGTLREHKGLDALKSMLSRDGGTVMHVFGPVPRPLRKVQGERLIVHPGNRPLTEIYAEIDVVVLPQGTSTGASLQLPAKLLDAMRFGVPVVATPTPAIEEIAADAYHALSDWNDPGLIDRAIRGAVASGAGAELQERFNRLFSVQALSSEFAALTERVCAADAARRG